MFKDAPFKAHVDLDEEVRVRLVDFLDGDKDLLELARKHATLQVKIDVHGPISAGTSLEKAHKTWTEFGLGETKGVGPLPFLPLQTGSSGLSTSPEKWDHLHTDI